jgi:hypothetical protein
MSAISLPATTVKSKYLKTLPIKTTAAGAHPPQFQRKLIYDENSPQNKKI